MPYQREGSSNYQIQLDLHRFGYPHTIGRRTAGTDKKERAEMMEATLRELAAQPRYHPLLDQVREGELSIARLHAAKINGELDELLARAEDPPLRPAAESWAESQPDFRYEHAIGRLLEVAPEDARLSWLADPDHLRDVYAYYEREGYAPATVQREMAGISQFMRRHLGDARRDRVFEAVKDKRREMRRRVDREQDRERWLSQEEIDAVREAAGEWWTVIGLAISTGLRRGELLELRVKDVDLEDGAVLVQEGKSKLARRRVPLGGTMLERIRTWVDVQELSSSDPLFPGLSAYRLQYAWNKIREEAGVEDCTFHGLRHTFAVQMAKTGVPLSTLKQLMGHSDIHTTERYAIYRPEDARQYHDRMLARTGFSEDEAPDVTPIGDVQGGPYFQEAEDG